MPIRGTMAAPFATIKKGADTAAAGDTAHICGGSYSIITPKTSGAGVTFTKSGTSDTKVVGAPGRRSRGRQVRPWKRARLVHRM
jgi:hypothetical protein